MKKALEHVPGVLDANADLAKAVSNPTLASNLTCPACGHASVEMMPTDACIFFWNCPACGARSKPKAGDCCVFCSYGSVPCPPVQSQRGCCD